MSKLLWECPSCGFEMHPRHAISTISDPRVKDCPCCENLAIRDGVTKAIDAWHAKSAPAAEPAPWVQRTGDIVLVEGVIDIPGNVCKITTVKFPQAGLLVTCHVDASTVRLFTPGPGGKS